jgi:CheY-like chemotaxis protein
VAEVNNGQEALDKACQWHPHVVFLDLVMPIMDGFTTARAMRQIPELQETVIFAISASVFDFHKQESITAGCNDFIAKPFRLETLMDNLRTHLHLHWIYGESSIPQDSVPIKDRNHDVQPSREHLNALENLARIGDIQGILDYTRQIEQSEPKLAYFSKEINQLAKGFKKKLILNLIKKYTNELNSHE